MEKRKRNYTIFLSIIAVDILLAYLKKTIGFTFQSELANRIYYIIFYSPIIAFVSYISSDGRLSKTLKIVLRVIAAQMVLAIIIGVFFPLLF